MKLDEIAKELGYTDKAHLEQNVEAYGAPLDKWWNVMQKVVNKLPIQNVSDCFSFAKYLKDNYQYIDNTKDGDIYIRCGDKEAVHFTEGMIHMCWRNNR